MAQVDFYNMLSGLGDTIAKQRKEDARKQAFADINNPDGTVDYQKAIMGLTRAGDVEGAARISQLAGQIEDRKFRQSTDARDAALAREKFDFEKKNATPGGGVYGTPIYGKDPGTGEVVLGAIAKDGSFRRINTGGVTPTPGGIKPLDTGSGFVPFDPRGGGVVGPAIPKTGEVSKDYAPFMGPDGLSARPIPGTPAAQKIEEEQSKAAARSENTAFGGRAVKAIISDVRNKVEKSPVYNPAVGFGSETAAKVAGSNASDTAELIKTVTANIGFDRLQRMRDESPTGGALGQVAVQELASLQKTIASLAQRQSQAQFLENLKRVEDQYDRIVKKASAYPNAAKYGFSKTTGPIGPTTQIPPAAIEALRSNPALKSAFEAKYGAGTAGVVMR